MTLSTLQTKRLTLRALAPRDARVIAKALNNFAISKWLTMVPFPYGVTDAEWFINENLKGRFNARLIWRGDSLIGTVGLDSELGYWLAEDAWGRGYATEAAQAVVNDHFAANDSAIYASHFTENKGSQNVLQKLGFVDIGPDVHFSMARQEDVPVRNMELTRAGWAVRHSD
ncbi:GNAT family N-acetyltransferase [Yoonia sp. BS5-3]|uniref:GNAT family N-acetyltransferase n=1 Tax=Yoonia phaeophyticola TaxID=3137369 RepID=A0ABZ2V0V1_9RHOB